jgi:hypothetical protein
MRQFNLSRALGRIKLKINFLAVEKAFISGGLVLFSISLFYNLLILNFLGILSYIFPASAHLILGASLGVPLWAGLMIFC